MKESRLETVFRGLGFAPKQHRDIEVFQVENLMSNSGLGESNPSVTQGLSEVVRTSIKEKKNHAQEVESVRDYYLTHLILDRVTHDTLFRFVDDDFPFVIEGTTDAEKKAIKQAYFDLDLPSVLLEMLPTFLALGEYLFVWDAKNKQLDDFIPQAYWRAVYSRGKVASIVLDMQGFSIQDENHPDRVMDADELTEYLRKNGIVAYLRSLPRPIKPVDPSRYRYRVYEGRGILTPGVVSLLKSIRLMESIVPILQVLSADSRYTVKVRAREGSNHKQVMQLVRLYSRFLNEVNESVVSNNVDEVMRAIGKFKVIPVFGDKGDIEYDEVPKAQEPSLESIQMFKSNLSDAIPLDPEYLGLPLEEKTEKVQYYSLIFAIRRDLSRFVEQVLRKALAKKVSSFDILPAPMLGVDELTRADYLDMLNMSVDNMSRVIQSFTDLADRAADYVNMEALADVINKRLLPVTGGQDIVKVPSEE